MIRKITHRGLTVGIAAMVLSVAGLVWQAAIVDPGPALAQYETPPGDGEVKELTICHVEGSRKATLVLPESEARVLLDNYEETTLGPCSDRDGAPLPPDTGNASPASTQPPVLAFSGLFAAGALLVVASFLFKRTRE